MSDYFLADDLSGALDAAAAFHKSGRRVKIALSAREWPDASPEDVVGITTETRNATGDAAAEIVRGVVAQARERGDRLIYKKIDSTLRGPVAAELAALAAALPEARFLFAPSNPAVGRTVRAGRLLVHGVPVAETEFARDPISPVRESSIPVLLGDAGAGRVTIADAETAVDLAKAVQQMQSAGKLWVAIGSGALAHPLAALGAGQSSVTQAAENLLPQGPAIFVGGSAHAINRIQAGDLARACGVPVREVRPGQLDTVTGLAISDIARHGSVALLLAAEWVESGNALRSITNVAQTVALETQATRIFATGGETAFAVCRALSVSCLTFHQEVEPGLGLAWAEGTVGTMCWAVKPGGFGDANTWTRAARAMRTPYFI
jgi:uncharacterized protein YgbK (DUF1537 family)